MGKVLRDQLIADYAPLVRFLAQRIASRLPDHVRVDDLTSAGIIGLIDAIEKFDTARSVKFKTYAEYRITGAILDELREGDWIPRSVRDIGKRLESVRQKIEQLRGGHVHHSDMAEALGMSVDEYHQQLSRLAPLMVITTKERSLENISSSDEDVLSGPLQAMDPVVELSRKELRDEMLRQISALVEDQRLVMSLYYYEGMTLKEIGNVMSVSESRVCQIHSGALSVMRGRMRAG
jgi:RNA polymerase sigma factor for flagellar operon FliA